MQIRIFNVSINSTAEEQEELNRFLRGHRVTETRQQYDENRGLWTFAVSYIDSISGGSSGASSSTPSSEKVDYRNVLSPEIFSVFSKLREARKKVAKDESVPVYAIFTNKELSQIASLQNLTIAEMIKIDGINKGRAEKYGVALLQNYSELPDIVNEAEGMAD